MAVISLHSLLCEPKYIVLFPLRTIVLLVMFVTVMQLPTNKVLTVITIKQFRYSDIFVTL